MKFVAFALAVLAAAPFTACDDEEPTQHQLLDEFRTLSQATRNASFLIQYELSSSAEPDPASSSVAKLGEAIRLELKYPDPLSEHGYLQSTVESTDEDVACVVRDLVETDERVCVEQEDKAWTIVFVATYPAALAAVDEQFSLESLSIARVAPRTIAGSSANCYRFTESEDGDSRSAPAEYEYCISVTGLPLFESEESDGESRSMTAKTVRTDITLSDLEIPYRLVKEVDLPEGSCKPPSCVRPD